MRQHGSRLAAKIDSLDAELEKKWDRKTVPNRARFYTVVKKSGTVFRSPFFARAGDTDLFSPDPDTGLAS